MFYLCFKCRNDKYTQNNNSYIYSLLSFLVVDNYIIKLTILFFVSGSSLLDNRILHINELFKK